MPPGAGNLHIALRLHIHKYAASGKGDRASLQCVRTRFKVARKPDIITGMSLEPRSEASRSANSSIPMIGKASATAFGAALAEARR